MLNNIRKIQKTDEQRFTFSLLLPTWNNLPYLQLCIESIRRNSTLSIQIIVIVNDGSDGTIEWLEQQNTIDYVHAVQNIGICYGLNIARSLVKADYIVYLNDDMYVLPDWDTHLFNEIKKIGHSDFMLSGTMIEPHSTGNSCVVVKDFGTNPDNFREKELLDTYTTLYRNNWSGSTWPPNVVHRDLWDLVGGFSVEFTPGMYSDPDFSKKVYDTGVRIFKGVGTSLVYHFGSKSTRRVKRNRGRNTFLLKWGITARLFTKKYLSSGCTNITTLTEHTLSCADKCTSIVKRILSCIR